MREPADGCGPPTTAMLLVPLTWSVLRSLLRRDVGVDVIALVAMAGALVLGEYLAGAVVALMLAGGNALEERASRRARRELTRARRAGAAHRAPCAAATSRGGAGRRGRRRATSCSSGPARSCRSTACVEATRRCSTSRR